MSRVLWGEISPERVHPEQFALLLSEYGWQVIGGREGLYSRWVGPEEEPSPSDSLVLPLNREAPDYSDLVLQALAQLGRLADERRLFASHVLSALAPGPGDEIRFRKETLTTFGAVPWSVGEELIQSARDTLVAAAKARVSKASYYGNRSGRFAHRYLDSVLMGQTDVGSYVVTAYSPPDRIFQEKESRSNAPAIPGVGEYTGREIARSLTTALAGAQVAIKEYARTASITVFDEAVKSGVSKEMASALRSLVMGAEGATVTVEWSARQQPKLADQPPDRETELVTFEFSGDAAPLLERAVTHLSTLTPTEYVRATGWVSVVARPRRGQPGLISLKVLAGTDARTLRVRLTDEQFQMAAQAITAEQGVSISGRQEKEGRTYWLYDAGDLAIAELPALGPRRRSPEAVPGQLSMTDHPPD
jgi:hypothetical protein